MSGLTLSLTPYQVYYAQGVGEQPNLRRAPSSPYSTPNCGCGDNETCVDSWTSDSSKIFIRLPLRVTSDWWLIHPRETQR